MDSASPQPFDAAPPAELSPHTIGADQRSRGWFWTALAIGLAAALANAALDQLTSTLRQMLIFNPLFYYHQSDMNIVLGVVGALIVPALAILFALLSVRARSGAILRRNAWAPIVAALVAMAILALCVQFAGRFFSPGIGADSSPAEVTAQINELSAVSSVLAFLALAIGLIFAFGALTASRASTRRLPRMLGWALAGALVGLITSAYVQAARVILLTLTAIRLAQVGAFTCMANSGANCYPQQMFQVFLYTLLPAMVGGAIGGMIGGALGSRAVAPLAPEHRPPDADAAGDESSHRRSWLVVALQYAAAVVIGALYAAYTLALVYVNSKRPTGPGSSSVAAQMAFAWSIALALLALAVPALWLTLAIMRRRAATHPDGGQRAPVQWLTVGAVTLALATPASVLLAPGFNVGAAAGSIILAAFAVGAVCGLIWTPPSRRRHPRIPWKAGLLAATPVWLGVSLVGAALVGVTVYSASQPASAGGPTCHGLGCGGLLMILLDGVTQVGVNYLIYGLPAALFAGGLSALIRARAAR